MLQRSDQVSETENFHEGSVVAESNGPAQDAVVDHTSTSVDEAIGELPKHTYASIVCCSVYSLTSVGYKSVTSMILIFLVYVVYISYVSRKDNLYHLLLVLARISLLLLQSGTSLLFPSLQTSNDLHHQTHMKGLEWSQRRKCLE